jgi:hypothetical protein
MSKTKTSPTYPIIIGTGGSLYTVIGALKNGLQVSLCAWAVSKPPSLQIGFRIRVGDAKDMSPNQVEAAFNEPPYDLLDNLWIGRRPTYRSIPGAVRMENAPTNVADIQALLESTDIVSRLYESLLNTFGAFETILPEDEFKELFIAGGLSDAYQDYPEPSKVSLLWGDTPDRAVMRVVVTLTEEPEEATVGNDIGF